MQAIIGVSENNPNSGQIISAKTGKAGRPKKEFKLDCGFMPEFSPDPHIHILLTAKPGDTVANAIINYLNKKHKSKVCWKKDCSDYKEAALEYIKKQSLTLRTLNYDPDSEHSASENEGIIFTKVTDKEKTGFSANYNRFLIGCITGFELECNISIIRAIFYRYFRSFVRVRIDPPP